MDSLDLTFLKENEIEIIVSVIEKDFEVIAAEKARLCRLRKRLIQNDQMAVDLSQTTLDGLCCVICFDRFVFIFNPKKICCSCSLQICKSCCKYIKLFDDYVCSICQQQKDLIAMNCSWFYENIRRKFMDGGSQIVANSLSDYPRKNLISPAILNMVKGTQITKFRLQIEEATRTIEESLIKVELSVTDNETKSLKYTELIQKFVEKLKQILRSTSQVLYVTMENYLNKTGKKNTNIDVEVLTTLHEEVELLIGRKIDVKMCQKKLIKGRKKLEDLDNHDSIETTLSAPIVDKLLYDVQRSLMETRGKRYEELNYTLQSMVKKNEYDSLDYDFESVSQAPSRQGTIRQSFRLAFPPPTLFENPQSDSDNSSKLYDMSELGEKTSIISKQCNSSLVNSPRDFLDSSYPETLTVLADSNMSNDTVRIDSNGHCASSAPDKSKSNWITKARYPLGTLNSLINESNNQKESKESLSTKREVVKRDRNLEEEIDEILDKNVSVLSDPESVNIDKEYLQNLTVITTMPEYDMEGRESQDSGIVSNGKLMHTPKPTAPPRKRRTLPRPTTVSVAPSKPTRKSYTMNNSKTKSQTQDSDSNSSVDNNQITKITIAKSNKNKLRLPGKK